MTIFREDLPDRAEIHTLGGFSAHAARLGIQPMMPKYSNEVEL